MLNGDGVSNPGEDPSVLLSDYCVPCGPGVFCDEATSATPQNCPAGTYGALIGAKSPMGCLECPVGTYQDMDGQFECSVCPANTFASSVGSTKCLGCGDGYEVSATGSDICNACPAGKFRDSALSENCQECPAGTSSGEGEWSVPHLHKFHLVNLNAHHVAVLQLSHLLQCMLLALAASVPLLHSLMACRCRLPLIPDCLLQLLLLVRCACRAATLPPPAQLSALSVRAAHTKASMGKSPAQRAARVPTRTPVLLPSARSAPLAPSTRPMELCQRRRASACCLLTASCLHHTSTYRAPPPLLHACIVRHHHCCTHHMILQHVQLLVPSSLHVSSRQAITRHKTLLL